MMGNNLRNFIKRKFGEKRKRRIAWHKFLENRAKENNLAIYKPHLAWLNDPEFSELRKVSISGTPDDRLFLVYSSSIAASTLDGGLAECGVREGRSSYFILKATESVTEKTLYLFDSFEGLSTPSEQDLDAEGNSTWREGLLSCSEERVKENLQEFHDRIKIHKGWIPDCFNDVPDERFCFVHIDVDLFDPTLRSIEFFYPRLVPNGILICDDYGFESCPGAKKAIDTFFSDKPEHVLNLPSGQCIIVKR